MTTLLKEWVDAVHREEPDGGQLPAPVLSARIGAARFFVYRVKRSDERHFPNARLLALLKEARQTYERYGRMPPIDEYDKKSAIYLAQAVYAVRANGRREGREEWLSVRFIPAAGSPRYTEDLLVCRAGRRSLLPILREKICDHDPACVKCFVTLSRLCRIAPAGGRNRYTPELFALMSRQFALDCRERQAPYTMLTALLQPRLIARALTHRGGHRPPFLRAERTLGMGNGERLRIHRTLLSYRYPGYFLRMDQLAKTLARLAKDGKVPARYLLKHIDTFEAQLAAGRSVAPLLLADAALRKEIDKTVGDAVTLYLTPLSRWERGIERMLRRMNIRL